MTDCVHHWIIETWSRGGVFPAHCKKCAERRDFPAVTETQRDMLLSTGSVDWFLAYHAGSHEMKTGGAPPCT
jgi:hypothetical protein